MRAEYLLDKSRRNRGRPLVRDCRILINRNRGVALQEADTVETVITLLVPAPVCLGTVSGGTDF